MTATRQDRATQRRRDAVVRIEGGEGNNDALGTAILWQVPSRAGRVIE